jgi:ABC-type Fe3+ transport system substrate-binding protein
MGYYFLLAINPLVIVVDHTRLEGRPTPLRWSDLLLPHYHQQIVMRAQKDIFCETVLFSFYKEFRIDGIKQLARNVRIGCHPAEMTKHVGSTKPDWPAISLMPYFFAKTIRNSDKMTIIWPFDGAIASPITMMVQRTALPDFQLVIDFLTGSVMAKLWSNAFFFPPFAGSSPSIENNRRLKWLGWDFIHSIDAHELFEHLNDVFCQAMQDVSKEVQ